MAATFHDIDPFLQAEYHPHGHVAQLSNRYEYYSVGCKEKGRGIIILPDLDCWNSGRIHAVADFLGANGYYVTIPRIVNPAEVHITDRDETVRIGNARNAYVKTMTHICLYSVDVRRASVDLHDEAHFYSSVYEGEVNVTVNDSIMASS